MDICLRMLKESNKSRFDSYSVRNSVLLISHITFRDCRVHIFPTTFLEIAVYSMFQSTTKILSLYDNVLKDCIFNTDLLSAKFQHRTPMFTAQTVGFISSSTDTLTFRKVNWHNMSFHPHHIAQCIPSTSKGG